MEKDVHLPKTKPMARKQIGIKLEEALIEKLKAEALKRNRTVTNLIETILKKELDLL